MLPPLNRLKEARDFRRILKNGHSFYTPNLWLKLAPNYLKVSRFGFSVGLSLSKKATVRNRLKRQAREIIRLKLKKGLIKPNFDVILSLKIGLIGKRYSEIEEEVDKLLKKAGLWLS